MRVEHDLQAPGGGWSGPWRQALARLLPGDSLAQGLACMQSGQVRDLQVQVGQVLACVQGLRSTPYQVRLELALFNDAQWERLVQAMASQAGFAAHLLNGSMPHAVEQLLDQAGAALFPASRRDLRASCTCLEASAFCQHAVAVCLSLGQRLDQDPFLLFTLRGRTQEQVMAALRAWRAQHALELAGPQPGPPAQRAAGDLPLQDCLEHYWQLGPEAATIQIHIAAPEVELELLKVLGTPAFVQGPGMSERLAEIYRQVSRRAIDLAFE